MGFLLLSYTVALLPMALCCSVSLQALAAASRARRACLSPTSAILLSMKSGRSNPLLNVTFPFSFSLVNVLANGSISCWLSVNFSAWGFLSGVALQREANRSLWLRRGRVKPYM